MRSKPMKTHRIELSLKAVRRMTKMRSVGVSQNPISGKAGK